MSNKYLIKAPPAYTADQLLRFGAFGAVFGASLAAGTAIAAHRQGVLTREQVLSLTLQGSLKAGLASAAGAALASAVGGPAALRLAMMALGSTATSYALTPKAAPAAPAALTAEATGPAKGVQPETAAAPSPAEAEEPQPGE
ncbi:MAG: hypothetical protein JNM48_01095 [Rhodospirillales bacterium]|nr:hypothetical protein [Rhodospirillales bacterium]